MLKAATHLIAALLVLLPVAQAGAGSLHDPFDGVLDSHVSGGRVDYSAVAKDPRFQSYLEDLSRVKADGLPSRQEKLAYWINAYNAFAIKGILDGYSPGSFFGRISFFKTTSYDAGGTPIDLYALEREVLVPMDEPRIHFAIVCASHSCPHLRSEAYTAEELERQLDQNARAFINDPQKNRFDRDNKVAHLSKIFDWFDADFAKHSGSVLEYVAQYVADPELAKELQSGDYTIKHLSYDWTLNGSPPES